MKLKLREGAARDGFSSSIAPHRAGCTLIASSC
jgi:hypothetical protein